MNKIKCVRKVCYLELNNKEGKVNGIVKFNKDDLEKINKYRWYKSKDGYAVAHIEGKLKTHLIFHNLIMDDTYIDHINNVRLDNRKINLRKVTHSQNKMNRPAPLNNKSGTKGLFWDKNRERWIATMLIRGKLHLQKRFSIKEDAIKQRKEWEKLYFKEYNYKV